MHISEAGGGITHWCDRQPTGNLFVDQRKNPPGVAPIFNGIMREYDWWGTVDREHLDA